MRALSSILLATSLTLAACSGSSFATPGTGDDASGDDTGKGTGDSATTGLGDAISEGGTSTDSGSGISDSAVSSEAGSVDSAPSDTGASCLAAGSCKGFPGISTFATDATDVSNCAGALHQTNCCGAKRAYGINHGVRGVFCTAENSCRASYPATPGCSDQTITTDSGETTINPDEIRVGCESASTGKCQCKTFLCKTDACKATSVPLGACG